uniref:Uncharacterized protein n=1 Tax=Ditylenchus dipsaci TaxID=166011 RepID=A0A915D5A4_9BILA
MGKTGLLRIFLPKRKQTALNLCLFIVLLFMLSFIALREWMNHVERLPVEKGRIYPKNLPAEVHIRPDPKAKMKGPGEMGAGVELRQGQGIG